MNQIPARERPSRLKLFLSRNKRLLQAATFLFILGAGTGALYVSGNVQKIIPSLKSGVNAEIPLKITSINITGNKLISDDSVRKALEASPGDPLLQFDAYAARERISQLPFADQVSVERKLSGQIIVRITERPPFAIWQYEGKFILIGRDGEPLPDQSGGSKDNAAFLRLPLLVGEGANKNAAAFIDILNKEPDVKERMTAATLVNQRRWTLFMKNGTHILLPENEEAPALHRLSELQQSMSLLDRPVRVIDLRLPDRLTIQKLDQPPAADPKKADEKNAENNNSAARGAGAATGSSATLERNRPNRSAPAPEAGKSKDQPREERRPG